MHIDVSKNELIGLIKSVPISYRRYTQELNEAGKWSFNMDGPTRFNWDCHWLESKTEEYLYDFYQKLCRGELYLPEDNTPAKYEALRLPGIRRQFPTVFPSFTTLVSRRRTR